MNLTQALSGRKCFKLICGARNEDCAEVEKLVAVYAKAGVNYFDLSAREDILLAAKRGLSRVVAKEKLNNYFFCVSVGTPGDPHLHLGKANMEQILPALIKFGIDSIELHAATEDEEAAYKEWRVINKLFSGILSLCLNRSELGDKQLIARINRFISIRKRFTTIVQADGAPMSGGDDHYNTTLQALATADIVQKAKLPVWVIISGGTNSKTAEMAKLFELNLHGIAIGSFARKIIKEYIERDDFLTNKLIFNKAYIIAKRLVDKSFKYFR